MAEAAITGTRLMDVGQNTATASAALPTQEARNKKMWSKPLGHESYSPGGPLPTFPQSSTRALIHFNSCRTSRSLRKGSKRPEITHYELARIGFLENYEQRRRVACQHIQAFMRYHEIYNDDKPHDINCLQARIARQVYRPRYKTSS